jgi:hypothetical protein
MKKGVVILSNENRLQYVSEDGLSFLKQNFDDNLQEYIDNNQHFFLDKLKNNNYLLDSPYVVEDFTKRLSFSENTDEDDLENVQIVYEAMKNIPAFVMMDDRFWTGMNHTLMWDYIHKRRKDEAFTSGVANQRDKIFNSFFTHTRHGKKRGTYVNCVSRLWWTGHLTYNKQDGSNPYALTAEVQKTGFASTILLLSSSNILSRHEAMTSLLKTIRKLRMDGVNVKRDDIIAGIKYLNLTAGSSLIDIMSDNEIGELLMGFYGKYYS